MNGQDNTLSTCSPLASYERRKENVKGSCLSTKLLQRIANHIGLQIPKTRKTLISNLHKHFNTTYGEEHKWDVKNASIARDIEESFRPKMPRSWKTNDREWLSNYDIAAVMKQYSALYDDTGKKYNFMGVYSVDFAEIDDITGKCVSEKMCKSTFCNLSKSDSSQYGIVFNMDYHTGPGTHWTAAYICLDPSNEDRYGIYYYDSVAKPPPPLIMSYFNNFIDQVRNGTCKTSTSQGQKFDLHYNKTQKQFKNSECGIYATFFNVIMVETPSIDFDTICTKVMQDDDTMHKLRSFFFRS